MEKDSKLHSGHWERVRQKVLSTEISKLTETEVLECVLQFVFTRGDINEIACKLLKRFGSFSAVLHATVEELCLVDGISKTSATKLTLLAKILDFFRACEANRKVSEKVLTISDCIKVANNSLSGLRKEKLIMICLNDAGFVNKIVTLAEGDESSANIDIKQIIVKANQFNAKAVVFAHNHPDSACKPSLADIEFTSRAYTILRLAGIALHDHIIIGGGKYFSFSANNLIAEFESDFKKKFS